VFFAHEGHLICDEEDNTGIVMRFCLLWVLLDFYDCLYVGQANTHSHCIESKQKTGVKHV